MSLYEQVKALNKQEAKMMTRFVRNSLKRNARKAKDEFEREQDVNTRPNHRH